MFISERSSNNSALDRFNLELDQSCRIDLAGFVFDLSLIYLQNIFCCFFVFFFLEEFLVIKI
jgi:hypothetical protein